MTHVELNCVLIQSSRWQCVSPVSYNKIPGNSKGRRRKTVCGRSVHVQVRFCINFAEKLVNCNVSVGNYLQICVQTINSNISGVFFFSLLVYEQPQYLVSDPFISVYSASTSFHLIIQRLTFCRSYFSSAKCSKGSNFLSHTVHRQLVNKMSIGVPIKVLHEAEGHIVTCETNTGEVYRGKLIEAEDNMNCQVLRFGICT